MPLPLNKWKLQIYETVTLVGIAYEDWTTSFSAAYENAYIQSYPYISAYATDSFLATPTTDSPVGWACTPNNCSEINTLFFFGNILDMAFAEQMLLKNTVLDADHGDPSLWAQMSTQGLVGEGCVALVRRGWTSHSSANLVSTENAINAYSSNVTLSVFFAPSTFAAVTRDVTGMQALASMVGAYVAMLSPGFAADDLTVKILGGDASTSSANITFTAYGSSPSSVNNAMFMLTNAAYAQPSSLASYVSSKGLSGVLNFTSFEGRDGNTNQSLSASLLVMMILSSIFFVVACLVLWHYTTLYRHGRTRSKPSKRADLTVLCPIQL